MAHVKSDRIQETSTGTGTGALTLAGAVSKFRAFSAALANADTCVCLIEHNSAAEWEVSLCTYGSGGNTLTRSTIYASSNGGSLVNFSAGTKTISLVAAASKSIVADPDGDATSPRDFIAVRSLKGTLLELTLSSAAGGSSRYIDSNAGGQTWQVGPGAGNGDATLWNFYNETTAAVIYSLSKTGVLAFNGASSSSTITAPNFFVGSTTANAGTFGVGSNNGPSIIAWGTASAGVGDLDFLAGATLAWKFQNSSKDLLPIGGNYNVGSGSYRVGTYYGVVGAINTSDRREKSNIRPLTAAELRVGARLAALVQVWQMNDSIAEKGESGARVHSGWVAQDVVAAFTEEGADPFRYGCVGFDELVKQEEFFEAVTCQKTRAVTTVESVVEIAGGRPVLVQREVTRQEPVGQRVAVVGIDGNPVMVNTGQMAEDGEPIMTPMMHFVPEMEVVQEKRTRSVPDIVNGERRTRLNVRPEQLVAFILASLHARVTALEPA